MRMDKGKPFRHVEADSMDAPMFSEAFLYETVGKGDARFILGVADEYEHIIEALGPAAVRAILRVKPRLVQRLEVGKLVTESLEDARDDQDLWREKQHPSQVIVDSNAAHEIWQLLHNEYRRFYNPEESMPRNQLRLYHTLTDALGDWEQGERKKEQDKLPEKLEKQKTVKERQKAEREKRKAAYDTVVEALRTGRGKKEALKVFKRDALV